MFERDALCCVFEKSEEKQLRACEVFFRDSGDDKARSSADSYWTFG